MSLGSRAARIYLFALGAVFLLAAPFLAPGGGYTCITGFKAALYVLLTAAFLPFCLVGKGGGPGFFRAPERLLALGYLFFCLLSALCSPWRRTAFLGGSRDEGFLHLALYALSFLALSRRGFPRRGLAWVFAAAVLAEGLFCLVQLRGHNLLGLYPPGMGWADAERKYSGAYLGTLGNTMQTGAVLACAAAFFFLDILHKGGNRFLLLPPAALSAYLLARMDTAGPILALTAVMLLALLPYGKTLGGLCRWCGLASLLLGLLLWQAFGYGVSLALTLLAGAFLLGERFLPAERDCRGAAALLLGLCCALGLVLVLTYEGWYLPLREARELLLSGFREKMGGGRVYIWRRVLAAARERFWLGTGPDTLSLRGLEAYEFFSPELGRRVTMQIDAAHCEYLHTLVCCGPGAAICHLGLALCAVRGFFLRQGAGRVCAGAAMCYAILALFGISMCAAAPMFWVMLALSVNFSSEGGADPEPDE